MRNHKIVIIIGAVLIFVVLMVWISFRKNQPVKTVTGSRPVPTAFLSPYQPNAPINVIFSFAPSFSLSAPSTAPVLSAQRANTDGFVEAVLTRLSPAPTRASLPVGNEQLTSWEWQTGSAGLSSSNNIHTFYFSDVGVSGPGWQLDSFVQAVRSLGITTSSVSLPTVVSGTYNFPYDAAFGPITKHVYSYTHEGSPILLGTPEEQSLVIYADASNRIRYMTMIMPVTNIRAGNQTDLITSDEVLKNLNEGRGFFVNSEREVEGENDNPIQFTSVRLDNGRLAYLLDPNTLVLRPVYLLDGVGTKDAQSVSVRYLLMGSQ